MAKGETPFKTLAMCSLGNPASVGQKPITFARQLIAASVYFEAAGAMPKDVRDRANRILDTCPGRSTASYHDPAGIEAVREDIRKYIAKRDGLPVDDVDGDHIYMTNGAAEAIATVMKPMIRTVCLYYRLDFTFDFPSNSFLSFSLSTFPMDRKMPLLPLHQDFRNTTPRSRTWKGQNTFTNWKKKPTGVLRRRNCKLLMIMR
jgi:hypothetical protein